MNEFDIVFKKAYDDGYIYYKNDSQKSAEESLHNFLFNQYLESSFNISLNKDNYHNYCTYENFRIYLANYYQSSHLKEKLSAIEKIDIVLNFFLKDKEMRPIILDHVIANHLVSKQGLMSYDDLQRCLKQLVKDEFLIVNIDADKKAEYRITWDGEYYHLDGGYKKDIQLENENRIAPGEMLKMQKQVNRLTWILVLTAGVSSVYTVIQICEYFAK